MQASLNATAPFIGLGPGDRRMDYGTKTFRDELPSKVCHVMYGLCDACMCIDVVSVLHVVDTCHVHILLIMRFMMSYMRFMMQ